MAFLTIGPQVIIMRVVVAAIAIFKRDIAELLKLLPIFYFLLMAIDARNRIVFAHQGKI